MIKRQFLYIFIFSLLSTEQNYSMWLPFASIIWDILERNREQPLFTSLWSRLRNAQWMAALWELTLGCEVTLRLSLNDAKQPINTNIEIWGVAGANILQDHQKWFRSFGHLSASGEELGGYRLSSRMTSYLGLPWLNCWWCYDSRCAFVTVLTSASLGLTSTSFSDQQRIF